MFPIILERDAPVIDWLADGLWATSTSNVTSASWFVRSDGLVKLDYGTLNVRAATVALAASKLVAAGIHITQPEPGEEFTPYAISCVAMGVDPNVRPVLFVGESPATITNDATGDVVTEVRFLAFGDTPGTYGSSMEKEVVLVINENTVPRALCIGVAMMSGTSSALAAAALVRLSVRRLIGVNPPIHDSRKL